MAAASGREAALGAALKEVPPFHAAAPRLAAPGAVIASGALGRLMELRADEFGVIRPADADSVRLADALRLPVLRSVDQKAPEPPTQVQGD